MDDDEEAVFSPPDIKIIVHDHDVTNDTTAQDKTFCEVGAKVIFWMWGILAPIIVVGGLISNMIVLLVFRYPRFMKTSTMLNMFILAVTDCVVLSIGPVRYWTVHVLDYDLRTISDFGCKLNYFVVYVSQDFSSWILVSLTYERVLSVIKPLQVRELLTVRRATFRLVGIFIIMCGINLHFFFTNGLVKEKGHGFSQGVGDVICDALTKEYKHYEMYIFVWIDMFVVSLIPFVIMAVSHYVVVYTLNKNEAKFSVEGSQVIKNNAPKQSSKSCSFSSCLFCIYMCSLGLEKCPFHSSTDPTSSTRSCGTPSSTVEQISPKSCEKRISSKHSARNRSEEVSQTLMLVTIIFIVMTLPNTVYFIADSFIYESSLCSRTNIIMDIIWTTTTLLAFSESGVNLYLYSARSHRFREEVESLMQCFRYSVIIIVLDLFPMFNGSIGSKIPENRESYENISFSSSADIKRCSGCNY